MIIINQVNISVKKKTTEATESKVQFPFSFCSMRDDKERRSLWPLTEQKESGENLYLTGYKFASTCLGFPNWMTRRQALLNANEKN